MHCLLGPLLVVLAAVAAWAPVGIAQVPSSPAPASALLPPAWLQAFAVHAGTVQSLQVPAAPGALVGIDVVLAGQQVTLELQPFDVRSPSFQLWTRTAQGLVAVPAPAATTWRGRLVGEPGSAVAATLAGGRLTAWVQRAGGDVWIVQPTSTAIAGAPAASHVVFRAADGAATNGQCGVTAPAQPVVQGGGGVDVLYECELALEADHPLFLWNGSSVAATQNDVLGIVNAVDLIYRNDVQVDLVVGQLIVDVVPDAYTTSNASALLTQFQNHWNAVHGAIPRDVAHLFSGRSIGAASGGTVGIALVGVVCDTGNGYGLSETHWSNNYAYRVTVTAHELGHNFNASHCDGQPACSIMCSIVGGCAANPGTFSPPERAQIIAWRQASACLAVQPTLPVVTLATPNHVATVDPPLVTLDGSGFVGTTAVTVGGQAVTAGLTVLSDTQLRFAPPIGLPLGSQTVTVTNPAGTSNAVPLTYEASNPCRVLVPPAIFGGASLTWRMGGWPSDYGFLGLSIVDTTTPWLGQPLLDGFLLLWHGGLDAQGMANFTVTVPPGLLTGFTVHSQLLDVDPTTNSLRSVSSLAGTWIVF